MWKHKVTYFSDVIVCKWEKLLCIKKLKIMTKSGYNVFYIQIIYTKQLSKYYQLWKWVLVLYSNSRFEYRIQKIKEKVPFLLIEHLNILLKINVSNANDQ